MKYLETRTVDEYQLDNGLIACIRTLSLPDSIRVDLSIYERMVDVPELLMYSNLKPGKENIIIDNSTIICYDGHRNLRWRRHHGKIVSSGRERAEDPR